MVPFSRETQAAFDAFVTPMWVIDAARAELIWANRAALALYEAPTLVELIERKPLRGASPLLLAELGRLPVGARLESELGVLRASSELVVTCTFTGVAGTSGASAPPLVLVDPTPAGQS